MRDIRRVVPLGGAIALALLCLAARPSRRAPRPKTVTVKIAGFAFSPPKVKVAIGDTVTWTNTDIVSHTVTALTASLWDSRELKANQPFKIVGTKRGSFAYQCDIHPTMKGTVEVR